jgi:catechol 2,3-dioxygenase-like lactoylglutathione lyase family enzyme
MKIRLARATNDLEKVLRFYKEGLGLEVLGSFKEHAGFDGVMLGIRGQPYHFEFTRQSNHTVGGAPTPENLVVFYLPEKSEWASRVEGMRKQGFLPVPSHNPYWDRGGLTFEDFEGYRVVLFNGEWK